MQKPIRNVLAPLDYTEHAFHAAWIALAIARSMQASLTLLHVHVQERARRVSMRIDADTLSKVDDEAYAALLPLMVGEPSAERLRAGFADGDAGVEECSHAIAEEIVAYAERQKTDLIVIGANVHSTLHDVLMGSVTNDVLENAACSVTVVH